jgi:hypothetical protein
MITLYGTIKLLNANARQIGWGMVKYDAGRLEEGEKRLRSVVWGNLRNQLEGKRTHDRREIAYVDPGLYFETEEQAREKCEGRVETVFTCKNDSCWMTYPASGKM